MNTLLSSYNIEHLIIYEKKSWMKRKQSGKKIEKVDCPLCDFYVLDYANIHTAKQPTMRAVAVLRMF